MGVTARLAEISNRLRISVAVFEISEIQPTRCAEGTREVLDCANRKARLVHKRGSV
ncbi:hypothetical protein DPMN_035342 [Dreissena polymorpha]|uniref:Uncharacterized protein n=1 Tax=Dreissena polymorpha TaxID=45954 RepID=A0A9D4RLU5_DREPO|nr:hypothetical protein DPMN_035342 [Dreissena polymorpha]